MKAEIKQSSDSSRKPIIVLSPESELEKVLLNDMFNINMGESITKPKFRVLSVSRDADKIVQSVTVGLKQNLTADYLQYLGFSKIASGIGAANPAFYIDKTSTILVYHNGSIVVWKLLNKDETENFNTQRPDCSPKHVNTLKWKRVIGNKGTTLEVLHALIHK